MAGPLGAIRTALGSRLERPVPGSSNLKSKAGCVAYVDESGKGDESEYFVLACIAGDAATMDRLGDGVRALKRGLVPEAEPGAWELHGKEIRHGPSRKKNCAPLRPRTKAKKIAVLNAIVNVICDYDVAVFGAVIKKNSLHDIHERRSVVIEYAMTFLLERLDLFLQARGDTGQIFLDNMRAGDRAEVERW